MVAGYHLIWTVYGTWLPNDACGSSSHEIRSDLIAELGELHYGRKKIQPAGWVIREFYERAQPVLKHPVLLFGEKEVALLATSFAWSIQRHRYTCYACAIMPDHIHMVIRKHRDYAEMMIENFQNESREELVQSGARALDHPVWGGPGWKVFLDTQEDIERTIKYVEQNPIKARMPGQKWPFVKVYDGWLPGGRMK